MRLLTEHRTLGAVCSVKFRPLKPVATAALQVAARQLALAFLTVDVSGDQMLDFEDCKARGGDCVAGAMGAK